MAQNGGIDVARIPLPEITPASKYTPCENPGGSRVIPAGTTCLEGHQPLLLDIVVDEDVAIPMRDGETIYADVYRPARTHETVPAIICAGPFGKNGGANKSNFDKWPWRFGAPRIGTSGLEKFEGLDPGYWCLHGYAIVHTGTWNSTGQVTFPSTKEGEDNYDIIEFLAVQAWCNGKVSMAGNSYLAMTQWFAGAANPPHLACLCPWEGISDLYNDNIRIGGSPDPGFIGGTIKNDMSSATGSYGIDYLAMCYTHPTWNTFWEEHRAALSKIQCPLYIVASWTNKLHTYGTFRAWQEAGSVEKWLRVHNNHEWPDLYDPQSREDMRRFYDYYLKGVANDWMQTPRVRLSVLNPGGHDTINRPEHAFPLARQEPLKLFLDAQTKMLSEVSPSAAASFSHGATDGSSVFSFRFSTTTELTGYSKLRLWAEAQGADDMDVFVHLQKCDAQTGEPLESCVTDVGFLQADPEAERRTLVKKHAADPSFAAMFFDTGPVGRLRASHRALDASKATEWNPVYTHREEQRLQPGEIVALDIGFWPYGWVFGPSEELRLTIAGYNLKLHLRAHDQPAVLCNKGTHVFYTGGERASFLLLPKIPSQDATL